jgi:hypothetical protein
MSTITVPSGRIHRFSAHPSQTRVCTLLSGRLDVRISGDEHDHVDDFVVGPRGIFRILPGKECRVANGGYVDVVVQVLVVE